MDDPDVLAALGPRLRRLRRDAEASLEEVAASTGISVSTLSRLETGRRLPTLAHLLPLARRYGVTLDDLVGAPETGDPRTTLRPVVRGGRTYVRLARRAGGVQSFKMVMPAGEAGGPVPPRRHEGHQWMHVLSGTVRVRVGRTEVDLGPGEVVEFDTRLPHVVSNPFSVPAEVLAVFGPQGERMRVRSLA